MSELEQYKEIMMPKGNAPEASAWLEQNGFTTPVFVGRCLHCS